MTATPTVTDPSAFTEKSRSIQVVLTIITGGLYTVYWLYSTAKQLDQGTDDELIPILGIIPVINIITTWQVSRAGQAVTNHGAILLFILFIIFPPLPWYWIQTGMNTTAAR